MAGHAVVVSARSSRTSRNVTRGDQGEADGFDVVAVCHKARWHPRRTVPAAPRHLPPILTARRGRFEELPASFRSVTTNDGSRVWLVTGASSGFERAIAVVALARGDSVLATARRTDGLSDLDGVVVTPLDVTDAAERDAAVATALERFGRIEEVVGSSPITSTKPQVSREGCHLTWRRSSCQHSS
jgi:short chain dehydrogenase